MPLTFAVYVLKQFQAGNLLYFETCLSNMLYMVQFLEGITSIFSGCGGEQLSVSIVFVVNTLQMKG